MNFTDVQLLALRATPKVAKGRAKQRSLSGHAEQDYALSDAQGNQYSLYVRQNERIANNFSCGLLLITPNGEKLTLTRYNGDDHTHCNSLEKVKFSNQCHIHIATERYILAGQKAEKYAEPTNRYQTLQGALHCLVSDYNIAGIKTQPDQPNLF